METSGTGQSDRSLQTIQTRRNFYTNLLSLAATVVIGIIYTPYLTRSLGPSAYGLVPLALIINQYIGVVTSALTGSFSRFYVVALQKGDIKEAERTICTSFAVILSIILFLTPMMVFLVSRVDSFFRIPPQHIRSAKILFSFTILSFFLSLMTGVFSVTIYALNRIDLLNWPKIFRSFGKLVLLVFFFELFEVDVRFIGITGLVLESAAIVYSYLLFRRYRPKGLSINPFKASSSVFRVVFIMASWVLLQYFGDTVLYRIDNIIVNRHWSIVESGALGAVTDISQFISSIVNVVSSLYGPLILIAYAKKRHEEVIRLSTTNSYIVGIIAAVLSGFIAGFSGPIVTYWLGPKFPVNDQYSIWLSIKVCLAPYMAAGGVLYFTCNAWNKVRLPAILTVVIGLFNLLVLVLMARIPGIRVWMLLLFSLVLGIVQAYMVNSFCVSRLYPGIVSGLLFRFLKITATLIVSMAVCRAFVSLVDINSFGELAGFGAIVGISIAAMAFFLCFNDEQRKEILNLVRK